MSSASPAAKVWASQKAALLAKRKGSLDLNALRASARTRFGSQLARKSAGPAPAGVNLGVMDVEPVVTVVMMMLAEDSEKEMKNLLGEMEALKNAKRKLQEMIETMSRGRFRSPAPKPSDPCQPPGCGVAATDLPELAAMLTAAHVAPLADAKVPATRGDAQTLKNELERKLRSLGKKADDESQKLQDLLQKQSEANRLMSNLVKNLHEPAKAIVQNLR